MTSRSEWHRKVVSLAARHGCTLGRTRGGHLVLRHPDGWRVVTSSTPSDDKAIRNVLADIRRYSRGAA